MPVPIAVKRQNSFQLPSLNHELAGFGIGLSVAVIKYIFWTLKRKKVDYKKTDNRVCVKDVKYIDSVKKRLVWVFYNGRDWGDDNETGWKERGWIEMSSTVLPFTITIITI